jgi:hypothetical protein
MIIARDFYLDELKSRMGGDLVKVVTGVRRCGKSFLLFNLFRDYLLKNGVRESHIISIALDDEESKPLRNPIALAEHIRTRLGRLKGLKYLFIDEIQLCYKVLPPGVDLSRVAKEDRPSCYVTFYDVLNEFRKRSDVDVYVTGSNSRMLSSDIATEFRGRSDEIRLHPLSFAEYMQISGKEKQESLDEYLVWGGLPPVALETNHGRKESILKKLFERIYIKDIVERHKLHDASVINAVTDMLSSVVGSLTNPNKLVKTLSSQAGLKTTNRTLTKYLRYLEDAFLFSKAERWDVRGKKFLDFPCKYYAEDTGLRNARLNFRELEMPHLMENAIWNELVRRGYSVDVGVISISSRTGGRLVIRNHEIDFIVNSGSRKIYIQSAFRMDDPVQRERETLGLRKIDDSFTKIVVRNGYMRPTFDEDGILHVGFIPFLLEEKIVDRILRN